jgi:hypothetical protein
MTLLVSAEALRARRAHAAGPLDSLARSLAADLRAVIDRPLYVPERKALLSREGGRCRRDGTLLDFDPFAPHAHRCPRCGEMHTGDLHDRFWIYWYQLWLAERAVHGALLGALGVEPRGTVFATAVLEAYTDLYPTYPNADNVLGPTRPFFSTYLESIWLLQLCVAADLLESGAGESAKRVGGRFRDQLASPSRSLIRSYDEGMSNRQVWNNAAMIASSLLLGRTEDAEYVIWSESGLVTHLSQALLPDGTWYEGENYHLFAHRGLWNGVLLATMAGAELPADLLERFDAGFATPFLTALPDFTLPSRRDSQYAISLRQWRFAEMCELGLARVAPGGPADAASGLQTHRILAGALTRMYAADLPAGDTGRARSSAEAERNLPATALTRADLGWKSLLFARPSLPVTTSPALPSVVLEAQGVGVLRRDAGQTFVALDYGHAGGGHGHPDRLNLLLACGATRWLDDFGTGSYVDPSLHWYRSTLAHNAPLVDGRSQPAVDGLLEAFDDRGATGWISATASIGSRATATRTVVVMPDYLIDELTWQAPGARFVDLPLHVDAVIAGASSVGLPADLDGGQGVEDGFRFLRATARLATVDSNEVVRLRAERDGDSLELWIAGDAPLEIWRAIAPAAPGQGDARFLILRSPWASGAVRTVLSWGGSVTSVAAGAPIVVSTREGEHHHTRVPYGWNISIRVGDARATIDLEGRTAPEGDVASAPSASLYTSDQLRREVAGPMEEASEDADSLRAVVLRRDRPVRLRLGEESYRRSEDSWEDAGEPTAEIAFVNEDGALIIEVAVANVDKTFAVEGAENPLDNEKADVNGAGVQLYLRTENALAGYLIVPRAGSDQVSSRPIDGWGAGIPIDAIWTGTDDGYVVEVAIRDLDLSSDVLIEADVVVNEMPAGRARRRGQLVLSGGAGEFVYLRGDRHDPSRLIPFLLTDD